MHGHIHSIDTLMYLLGDPMAVSVWGELRPRTLKIENNRLDSDPSAVYHIEFADGLEGWTIPIGHWDFEVFGAEGSIKGMNNGVDWSLRKTQQLANKRTVFRDATYPPYETRSATVVCLEDIVKAYEENRPTLGNVEVTHRATELCLAVAESHRQDGLRVKLPLENRDLYVWHV
jgi:predicted dehydrogenase